MSILDILTWVAFASSCFIVITSSPIVAVLWLVIAYLAVACYLIILNIGFIGLVYIIVYLGAVAILFLFVLILINVDNAESSASSLNYSKIIPLIFVISYIYINLAENIVPNFNTYTGKLNSINFNSINNINIAFDNIPADISYDNITNIQSLAISLYSYDSFALLVISILLLLAICGPVCLSINTHEPVK